MGEGKVGGRKVNTMKQLTITLILLLLVSVVGVAHAQSGGGPSASLGTGYDLEWNTIDNGGATFATGGGYELGGTIGQPDAGILSGHASGVTYTLSGGFWVGRIPTPPGYRIFLPLVMRNQ